MAIPSTTYDIATITNPTSALTDFTLMIDLSRMSSAWWAEVDTSDGTRGRASKNDGTTELATDWIDFDDTAETGLLRVKYTGTLASSGTQIIRVYPPNTGNSAYGVSDTYGQYNAYSSNWVGYWPLSTDFNDRTSNTNNGTGVGGVVAGDVSGYIGKATSFNGSEGVDIGAVGLSWAGVNKPASMLAIAKVTTQTSTDIVFGTRDGIDLWKLQNNNTSWENQFDPVNGGQTVSASSDLNWVILQCGYDGTDIYLDVDNVSTTVADSSNFTIGDLWSIGKRGNALSEYFNGNIQHVALYDDNKNTTWRTEEYSQTNDNATFWGTWTNVPVSGTGYELTLDTGVFTYTGNDLNLLKDSILETNTGVFNLTGNNLEFSKTNVLTLETGVFNLTGKSLSLIYDDGSQSAGSSPLGNRPKSYTKRQKQLYYIDKILRGI